jgi:putative Mg2+ transporter-C (MgtC) family protein
VISLLENSQFQIFFQLFLAVILGGLIGLEREYKKRAAGLRTYSLVSLGAALFTILGIKAAEFYINLNNSSLGIDPSRIIGQIVLGVGFLGAGLIIIRESRVEGLTTAAGLWVAAALGAAIGIKLYLIAAFTAFLTLGILSILRIVEEKIIHKNQTEDTEV